MKVIVVKDFNKLGFEGEVKDVSDGYARNFLIPRSIVVPATRNNLAAWEKRRKEKEAQLLAEKGKMEELAAKLGGLNVTIKVDAGESGKLFGSVTPQDVADAVREASGTEIDRRSVMLPDNIKGIGTHEVSIRLHPQVSAKVKVEVEAKNAKAGE